MKCPKCSLQNPETQKFCGDCGTRLISDEGVDATRTTTIELPPMPLVIGSTFAERYQIIEELGKGGMGRVFRALDKKLDEEIAVKFIRPDLAQDPQSLERFRTELKSARQVIHKNVCRMFDLNEQEGIPYITMEYVRGENLKSLIRKVGRLDARQAVPIARQVAEGLAEAHRIGVVHRDLKPHNIMIDEEGAARITDFGLASLKKPDDATMTRQGMGTPAYVSPEQLEGAATDGRSDVYSLGIVLYEMLTGETPFQGDSPYGVAIKRLTKAPPDPRGLNPEIPEALVQVIMKCLEKDPGRRYQSAGELVMDLRALGDDYSTAILRSERPRTLRDRAQRWLRARRMPLAFLSVIVLGMAAYFIINPPGPPSPWKTSIAVLPVVDLTPGDNKANSWYGLRSEISAKLHNIPELKVVSVPANYDPSGQDFPTIGKELGAEYLLRLSVQTVGTELKVGLELIEGKSGSVVVNYNHLTELTELASIYEVQDKISRQTARALQVNLVEERLRTFKKREPDSLVAYNHYLEGKRLIEEVYHNSYRPEDFAQAVGNYEKAIELDPNYAMAYWGLGNAYEARFYSRGDDSEDPADWDRMIENYSRAYEIEPEIAETNLGIGWVHFNMEDNVRASQHFKRAFELDPNNLVVNQDVGAFLRSVGFYHEAVKYFSRVSELNPHSVSSSLMLSSTWIFLGQFGKAIKEAEGAIKEDPKSFEGRVYCALGLIMLNRLNEAQQEIDLARKIDPKREWKLPQVLFWAAKGEKEKALELLNERNTADVFLLFAYLLLGMKEEAIRNIEECIDHGFDESGYYLCPYPMLAENPIFKSLRSEPRFQEILRREKARHEEKQKSYAKF